MPTIRNRDDFEAGNHDIRRAVLEEETVTYHPSIPTSRTLELAQLFLCVQPMEVLGRTLVIAGRLMMSEDPADQATGRLLEAQTLFAMQSKWDAYQASPGH
jgi:hypothetical protein